VWGVLRNYKYADRLDFWIPASGDGNASVELVHHDSATGASRRGDPGLVVSIELVFDRPAKFDSNGNLITHVPAAWARYGS